MSAAARRSSGRRHGDRCIEVIGPSDLFDASASEAADTRLLAVTGRRGAARRQR
jgi:hypothetical protein